MVFRFMLIAIIWSIIVFMFLKLWSKYLASVDGANKEIVRINATKNNGLKSKGVEKWRR